MLKSDARGRYVIDKDDKGKGGPTHIASQQMAAAAIAGQFVDVREWDNG